MDPGQEKDQQGDQLEAHSVELPADGAPTLEEDPDDGKDLGKVWSDVFPQMSDNMVSGNHGEESRCSSPPLSEPILSPDDSRPLGTSQHHQVGLVGDVACVTSVINRKRTKDSDSEEEPPAKKTRDTVDEEELPSKRTRQGDSDEEELPAKRSRNSVNEEELLLSPSTNTLCEDPVLSSPVLSPSQGTVHEDSLQLSPVSNPSPMTFWLNHLYSPFSISPESTSEDPILSSPVFSPLPRLPYGGPIELVHDISPPVNEDLALSSTILSRLQSTECEDPSVSSSVVSPSPSPYCKIPSATFPCICVLMKSQMDKEEEPRPSTSGIGSDRIRERVSSRQVWLRPHYDLSSDSD
ncbi:uncharacterized protein LOC122845402 [Gambusia affinis]|uniref:uncharacterized protein LOC122845402 n=1 Tax=Gambusia affinis TaxID=33528 RepID=UPI001CDC6E30|nr:uncharacterized protein LOC122845402 [Gambusia affinis]XP_043997608.1 uncharacterized protein LOC122845402 [Gambusia affinis]XP_043997609.1 uncharacterized protein LOC122845402 [Gambusia affinis]XP_043997610.1 uncharacterized protein LOC122845402 [Gambusia affinis]XP_043997611.1 uncharacterized protein LOC122845402 [Gambusia affinis]XP_043997613.1 uncharacterized protein LOC122845402 [Gambusia affinis]